MERDNEQRMILMPESSYPVSMDKVSTDDYLPRGHVLMAEVDKDGKEIPNTDFVVLERGYKKRYTDTTKFILKKKAKTQ